MSDASAGATSLRSLLPQVLGRAKVVISPYPFGLSDDDNLRVTSVNAVTGVTLEVHYRLLTREGEVKAGVFKHVPNSNRTAKTDDFPLAGGFVTNLSVFATGGSPLVGQTFVIVQLIRGIGSVAVVLGTMLQGYVTTTQGLGWPGSSIVTSTDGEPVTRSIVGTQPANGANIVETVPTGARWELVTLRATITPQLGPISATPILTLKDPSGNTIVEQQSNATFSTSVGVFARMGWSWGIAATTAASNLVNMPMPQSVRLLAGSTINVQAVSGTEHWDAPIYSVREWQEAA